MALRRARHKRCVATGLTAQQAFETARPRRHGMQAEIVECGFAQYAVRQHTLYERNRCRQVLIAT